MRGCRRSAESARAQHGPQGSTMYQPWESGAGMVQAGFTEAAAWSPLSTQDALGAGMKTRSPGARGAAPARGGGPWCGPERWTGIPAPHLGAPGAQVRLWPASAPPARPGLLRHSPSARPRDPRRRRAIWARQQSGNGERRQPGAAGTRPGSDRRPRRFCSARVCVGSCPRRAAGPMKGPSVCAPAAPLAFHS